MENLTFNTSQDTTTNVSGLKTFTVPDGTISLCAKDIPNRKNIEFIQMPDSVEEIEDYTFLSCTSLKKVNLSKALKRIGEEAFAYCQQLKSITLPSTITSIGITTFNSCDKLEYIYIPKGTREKFKKMLEYAPFVEK